MAITEPADVLTAVAQLQYLSRKGAFAVPLRMKWLPPSLKGATLPDDVRRAYEPLQAVLRVDFRRISEGGELPEDTARNLSQLDRHVVLLRFADEDWKAKLAEDILAPLIEETGGLGEPVDDRQPGQLPDDFNGPTWVKLYRSVQTDDADALDRARIQFQLLDKLAGSTDRGNPLAMFSFMARRCDSDQWHELVLKWTKVEAEHPGSWQWLLSDDTLRLLIDALDDRQLRNAFVAATLFVSGGDTPIRAKLVADCFARRKSVEWFVESLQQLAQVDMQPGLAATVEELLVAQPGSVGAVMGCLIDDGQVASRDAQHLIGQILARHPIAEKKVFRKFCHRIAQLELSSSLRHEWDERVDGNPKLTQAIIEQKCEPKKLVGRLRSAGDNQTELFWLLLIAVQLHDKETLGDISRGLSLLSVAIGQNKIDSRHLGLAMEDFRGFPLEALLSLSDERHLDGRQRIDAELKLLYLSLRIIGQTAERIDGLDLDHLSNTLRKLRVRDARARD